MGSGAVRLQVFCVNQTPTQWVRGKGGRDVFRPLAQRAINQNKLKSGHPAHMLPSVTGFLKAKTGVIDYFYTLMSKKSFTNVLVYF